jgi:hypothetical protein
MHKRLDTPLGAVTPHTLMVEGAALFGELSQNSKNGADLYPR